MSHRHAQSHQDAVVVVETGGDEARMKTVSGYASPREALRKLERKQDVGQFAFTVSAVAHVRIAAFGIQVVERDLSAEVGSRRRGDDARGCAGDEPVEQERGEE